MQNKKKANENPVSNKKGAGIANYRSYSKLFTLSTFPLLEIKVG